MKKKKIAAKPKVKVSNIFIRSVPEDVKDKFYEQADALGYKPKELFARLVGRKL
jgi:hypothetical protein